MALSLACFTGARASRGIDIDGRGHRQGDDEENDTFDQFPSGLPIQGVPVRRAGGEQPATLVLAVFVRHDSFPCCLSPNRWMRTIRSFLELVNIGKAPMQEDRWFASAWLFIRK